MFGLFAALVISYLLGSFPTSLVAGKVLKGVDLREHGSGNAGATNAFRVLGPAAGVMAIIGDLGKGVIATLLVSRIGSDSGLSVDLLRISCGTAAVVGHIWTVFAGFRGGKGVGTAAGMVLSLHPAGFGLTALAAVAVVTTTGIVSLASMAAALSYAVVMTLFWLFAGSSLELAILSWFLLPLILFTHRANIGRLFRGEEKSFDRLRVFRRRAKP